MTRWRTSLIRTAGLLLVAGVLGPGIAHGQAPPGVAESFLLGNRLYQEGKFKEAVGAYEQILDAGVTAPAVEYNLANAYLKAGEVGRAILHYRRALRADPTHESAAQNLKYSRSLTQDVTPEETGRETMGWIGGLRLGPVLAAMLVFLSVVVFMILAGLRLVVARTVWIPVVQGLAGVMILFSGAALVFEWSELEGKRDGVILVSEVQVRTGPGESYTVSFRLHEGTEVEVLRGNAGWREVRVSDRLRGWVPEKAMEGI